MKAIRLEADWTLTGFQEGKFDVKEPAGLERLPNADAADLVRVSAQVPGNVELDMVRAGILPDPFVGMNAKLLRPYEHYEWWYDCSFPTPADCGRERVELVFNGVDCMAAYWLNGRRLGYSDNMFIEHRFDVTGLLEAEGDNRLVVRIGSAVNAAKAFRYDPYVCAQPTGYEAIWIRKAPHSYGWDIMPRVVSAGLWRPVELVVRGSDEIEDLYFATRHADESSAALMMRFRFRTESADLEGFSIRARGRCGESSFEVERQALFTAGDVNVGIPSPRLWWPKGYGEPALYDVEVELLRHGEVLDRRREAVGVRTVELVRTDVTRPDEPGEFLFKVNGTPILAKGSNWVPADAFHSRDAGRYEDMLALFDDLGCNVLRCWGGNVYEDHAFYGYCDRHGIMVWQDFAMACALYPQDDAFQEKMRREAESVVRKLRNHPCIILWSGDNECDEVAIARGIDPGLNRITRETLPRVVHSLDPHRPYLPSSPYISPEVYEARDWDLMPEDHLWGPRDYYKSRYYLESKAHFVSEIGYHGCPNVSSVQRFIDPEHLWPCMDDEQWILHCSDPVGRGGPYWYRVKLMMDQVREVFGLEPATLEDFARASQICQAEAKKFFVEMTRLRRWRRTGVIWWNVIDGWPQFSDAVVDYYFGKKLAYHYIKRVQQPVCIMITEPQNWTVNVVAGNDSREDARGTWRLSDADTGDVLGEGDFHARANSNAQLGSIRASRGDQRLFLIQWETGGEEFCNHYLLATPPISFERYGDWLRRIAALSPSFDAEEVAR